jgi:hypothetical protein
MRKPFNCTVLAAGLFVATSALAGAPASSYKSMINIKNLFPGK